MRLAIVVVNVVALFTICGCAATESTRFSNRIGTFEKDPRVIGRWRSVDLVKNINDFKPGVKSFKGELYLKEFVFAADGKTHKPFWTWSKGRVFHSGDKTTARYIVMNIENADYLFLEWMSGDVTIRGKKPRYYVLKKAK
ncbi:MAG: hypothetical protein ACYS6W_16830 [Planctomycetota bacterium]